MLHRLPHDSQIYCEVTVRQRIAHFVGKAPRHSGVLGSKSSVVFYYVVTGLADDFKVTNHRIIGFAIGYKRR